MKKILILLVAMFLFVLPSCASPTCAELTVDYRANLDNIEDRFNDAFDLASNTSRVSLSVPISELQEVNRDAKNLDVPECAKDTQDALLLYQESVIDGFLAFLSQADDSEVELLFTRANERQTTYFLEYAKLTEEEE